MVFNIILVTCNSGIQEKRTRTKRIIMNFPSFLAYKKKWINVFHSRKNLMFPNALTNDILLELCIQDLKSLHTSNLSKPLHWNLLTARVLILRISSHSGFMRVYTYVQYLVDLQKVGSSVRVEWRQNHTVDQKMPPHCFIPLGYGTWIF